MMKRLNRLRKLWRLSSKDERKLALMLEMPPEVERAIPDAADTDEPGAFFPEATEADFKRQKAEDDGTAAWLDRLSKL